MGPAEATREEAVKRSRLLRRKALRRISPRRRLQADLDRAARFECLLAAGGACARCARTDLPLEWHHVIGRRTIALRWHPENALALCMECHRWWHGHPRTALHWFVEKFGEARLALLYAVRDGR